MKIVIMKTSTNSAIITLIGFSQDFEEKVCTFHVFMRFYGVLQVLLSTRMFEMTRALAYFWHKNCTVLPI